MIWLKILATVFVVVVVGVTVSVAVGTRSWRAATGALDARVRAAATTKSEVLVEVPEIVAAYLSRAVPDGSPPIRLARLEQSGEFWMGNDWKPFVAVEAFGAPDPAFYWDAKIEMLPFIPVRVRDSYVQGEAGMVARIGGIVTVMDAASDRGLIEGALMRYLAEAVWIPTRLGSGPGLTWTAVGADRARAELQARGVTVSMEFRFDSHGDPIGVSGIRKREIDGAYVDTPWEGTFAEHREIDGYRIPMYGEVAWVIDGVATPYWKGRITSAEFLTESVTLRPIP